MSLADQGCRPRTATAQPLAGEALANLLTQLPGWSVLAVEGIDRLQRVFRFRNFAEALAFSNRVGELAEAENHHPALLTEWGRVTVSWWTHDLGGIDLNDAILAARTDRLAG